MTPVITLVIFAWPVTGWRRAAAAWLIPRDSGKGIMCGCIARLWYQASPRSSRCRGSAPARWSTPTNDLVYRMWRHYRIIGGALGQTGSMYRCCSGRAVNCTSCCGYVSWNAYSPRTSLYYVLNPACWWRMNQDAVITFCTFLGVRGAINTQHLPAAQGLDVHGPP
jgi:hypothetical protein